MKQCSVCHEQFDDRFDSCPVDDTVLDRQYTNGNKSKPEFTLTMLEQSGLVERLTYQLRLAAYDSELAWPALKKAPLRFGIRLMSNYSHSVWKLLNRPNVAIALSSSLFLVITILLSIVFIDRFATNKPQSAEHMTEPERQALIMIPVDPVQTLKVKGTGVDGKGTVGISKGSGQGSGPIQRDSNGGGGSGDHNPLVAQNGKPPLPSPIPAAIPVLPPNKPPLLPDGGLDLDQALYAALPLDRFGDPRSRSTEISPGPGNGHGVGGGNGTGDGDGDGPGFGPGEGGNTGGKSRQSGCCGPGGGRPGGPDDPDTIFTVSHVQLKAKILFKPEPRYTEEARKNQITGTVILKAVLSSSGVVINIKPLLPLPFGLTEEAISAARRIKFTPAIKDQRAVSQWIQIEYNFNLY